jgi:voltage-gated potassium channel
VRELARCRQALISTRLVQKAAEVMSPERRRALFPRIERATEIPMLVLAGVFLVALALPELVDLSEDVLTAIEGVVWLIWGVFAFELLAKTYLAPDRRRYLMTHWPDVVVVAVPFLRPVRLLRLVMVGAKFWRSARTTLRRRTFSLLGSISIVSVSVAAVLMYAAERQSEGTIQTFADALWWAVATITTVGYGDVYPKTPVGRGIAVILMLIGISLFGVLTARLAAFFVVTDDQASSPHHLEMIMERLDRIEQQLRSYQASSLPPSQE